MKMNLDQRLVKEVIKFYMIQGDDICIDRFLARQQDKHLDIFHLIRIGDENYIKNSLLNNRIGCVTLENDEGTFTAWDTLHTLSWYEVDTQHSDDRMREYCDDIPGMFPEIIENFIKERNDVSNKIREWEVHRHQG